ncbi:unnamed protein product [Phytophthora fragariaefolia]|uniref:Unnamed protein product n=1 Tax=Phytophthora fragariaefolia TaxID=1490495 RepID=A0A9W6X6F2_9STRA|nr:unnamed protein product [Phytophthora fragariaefolia]
MARGQSPLARAQARALRALGVGTPSSAASPETSISVMAPPVTSPETGGGSPSRDPLAGAAEASAPSSSSTAQLATLVVRPQSRRRLLQALP